MTPSGTRAGSLKSAVDKVLAQATLDQLKVLFEGLLSAIVVNQILQHVARELVHAGVEGEPLVDDFAAKDVFEALVHGFLQGCRNQLLLKNLVSYQEDGDRTA
jgi:hypothetical protein